MEKVADTALFDDIASLRELMRQNFNQHGHLVPVLFTSIPGVGKVWKLEGRTEMVVCSYSSPSKEIIFYAQIVRKEGEPPQLGDWQEVTQNPVETQVWASMTNCRFCSLWQRTKSEVGCN
jgi:hypothetical protein